MKAETPIDWSELAERVGSLFANSAGGPIEHGSATSARAAIEILLTGDRLADAVDYYVAGKPGSELARSVLWLLHPTAAMNRCRAIFASDADVHARRAAVELLRVAADERSVAWIPEFLSDPDLEIQAWGIKVLDQLVVSDLVEFDDCAHVLRLAQDHNNPVVRSIGKRIADNLTSPAP